MPAAGDGGGDAAEAALQVEPLAGGGVHGRVELRRPVAPGGLGGVEGGVGVADQGHAVGPVDRVGGRPHAGGDEQLPPVHGERGRQRGDQPAGHHADVAGAGQVGGDEGELVAAHADQHVPLAGGGGQPARHLDQQDVTGGVAERVVDVLEPVQVDHQHAQRAAGAGGRGEPTGQDGVQAGAVGQAGQRVVRRLAG